MKLCIPTAAKLQVLIEEELGQNPESGEGWTEYNFQAPTVPQTTVLEDPGLD